MMPTAPDRPPIAASSSGKRWSRRGLLGTAARAAGTALLALLVCVSNSQAEDSPAGTPSSTTTGDPLSAWSPGSPVKAQLLRFVQAVSDPRGPGYVPPSWRIATFDVDGTLIVEKPTFMEVIVAAQRLCDAAARQPALCQTADGLYRQACALDYQGLEPVVDQVLLLAFLGYAQKAYIGQTLNFIETWGDGGSCYAYRYYQPMIQLVGLLLQFEFKVYFVSGSQEGFVRAFANSQGESGGPLLPPSQAIGRPVQSDYRRGAGNVREFIRQNSFWPPNVDGAGKAETIQLRLGQLPILAAGNTMGDFEMLQLPGAFAGIPHLSLVLDHDSPREHVYHDPELLAKAREAGWPIISMARDFGWIWPPGAPTCAAQTVRPRMCGGSR